MSAGARIAAFVGVLVLVFGGAALAGGAIEPHGANPAADTDGRGDHAAGEDDMGSASHSETGAAHGGDAAQAVRGLAVAADDLRIAVDQPELRRGRMTDLRFRIVDDRGETLRDFDVTHEKRMHLILARRDLSGLPAPAPDPGRRRQLVGSGPARRRRLLPAVRGLLARGHAADARHRPARRR